MTERTPVPAMKKHPDCEDCCQLKEHKGYADCGYSTGICAYLDAWPQPNKSAPSAIAAPITGARLAMLLKNQRDKVADALRLILPMAKGYAHAHQVGSNAAYIEDAEKAL